MGRTVAGRYSISIIQAGAERAIPSPITSTISPHARGLRSETTARTPSQPANNRTISTVNGNPAKTTKATNAAAKLVQASRGRAPCARRRMAHHAQGTQAKLVSAGSQLTPQITIQPFSVAASAAMMASGGDTR